MTPMLRLPSKMHHRDNENRILLNSVKNAIRKDVCQTFPDILFNNRPTFRRLFNPLNSSFNLQREGGSETRSPAVVKDRGVAVFKPRLRVKIMGHRPTKRRTSSSTCSPGIDFT